jgi:hypothetical protein
MRKNDGLCIYVRGQRRGSCTYIASYVAIQARKDQIAIAEVLCFAFSHDKVANLLGHGDRLLPPHRIAVFLAR